LIASYKEKKRGRRVDVVKESGAKIQVIQYENRLELIPIRDPKSLRGFLRGIDTKVDREQDRV
jgi:hypothetical protein